MNGSSSALRKVAAALRHEIAQLGDAELLGSEDELVARMGVSRPTFRLAAKLLEQEQILTIRRGPGGGFFTRRPSTKAVVHMAAVFLQGRKVTLRDVIEASRPLFVEIARLASRQRDPVVLQPLREFLATEREAIHQPHANTASFIASEGRFHKIYAGIGGNAVIELFYRTIFDFASRLNSETAYEDEHSVGTYRKLRLQLMEAILSGDDEIAVVRAGRLSRALLAGTLRARRDQSTSGEEMLLTPFSDGASPILRT